MISLPKLIERINSELHKDVAGIETGHPHNGTPKRNPFIYRFSSTKVDSRQKFKIYQESRGIWGDIFGTDSEAKIGYIFLETGRYDVSPVSNGVDYETLRLRIKEPLQLKSGLVIPNCSIKLLVENGDGVDIPPERRDHIRRYGLAWQRTDLSKVIPTQWFME